MNVFSWIETLNSNNFMNLFSLIETLNWNNFMNLFSLIETLNWNNFMNVFSWIETILWIYLKLNWNLEFEQFYECFFRIVYQNDNCCKIFQTNMFFDLKLNWYSKPVYWYLFFCNHNSLFPLQWFSVQTSAADAKVTQTRLCCS